MTTFLPEPGKPGSGATGINVHGLSSAGFAGDEVQTVYRLDGTVVRSFPVIGPGGHRATDLAGGVLIADRGGAEGDELTYINVVTGAERPLPDSTYAQRGVLAANGVVAAKNRNGSPARWKHGRELQLPQLGSTYPLHPTAISTDNTRQIGTLWTCRN
ncbi:hypothetical protein ACIA5G_12305 [Amycolatopsis sp. NPDC051758]|uniref:hypothetical protein n=1 Tax=Amycolatopsis sp. NPDC051758 TaxID=3363935 RepID=UPI0037B120A3